MSSDVGAAHRKGGRAARSRWAKPLLTSVGVVSLVAASAIVVLGVSATGSARPWDWAGAGPGAAVSRYQLCGGHGVSALGCMLAAAVRPAATVAGPADPPVTRQPLQSVVTVEDRPAPVASSRPAPTARPAQTAQPSAAPVTRTPRPRPSGPEPGDD